MTRIEIALVTNAAICDLSQAGDAAAWGGDSGQVQWAGDSASPDTGTEEKEPYFKTARAESAMLFPGDRDRFCRPVADNQRLPIAIMSGLVCGLLVSAAWYFLAYQPAFREFALRQQLSVMIRTLQERNEDAGVKPDQISKFTKLPN